jgi:ATP-dependent helicase Lhr and Lhr-like helicase
MNKPVPSNARESKAFDLLHPKVQRWIWRQGWEDLRDIQEISIPALAAGEQDVIIAAATASGKTEAAFLPIASQLAKAEMKPGDGFGAIYISPLRALINDQFGRLESLCEELEIPVFKWHGDVSASIKARARKKPEGIVLITPESLEALLMRSGMDGARLFRSLSHIVIDELHAFMDVPRGKQMQSLLHRVERMAGRRIPRVGLSATLSDMQLAATFLRPLQPENVKILESASSGQELKLQLRGYLNPAKAEKNKNDDEPNIAFEAVCKHLFQTLRGSRNLIFAGSRQRVEEVSAKLTDMCENSGVPGEFLAHHGSLARAYREDAESRMRDERLPASIVCTTTLELGIDIGNIESVAQIGPGHTVSGMRQRLGRSGRRAGQAAIFRAYVMEQNFAADIHPADALRPDTVQAVAMIELMLKRWNESPNPTRYHMTALMHQILALICQYGGISAKQAWSLLIESGVFANIDRPLFVEILKRMGDAEVRLIEQALDGTLLLGAEGERITSTFDFYAVFETPEEYRVVFRGKEIGRLPMALPYQEGHLLIFGGRYWKVLEVDATRREVLVDRSKGGRPPKFGGDGGPQSDVVVAEMRRIYEDVAIPRYLDQQAINLLHQARQSFTVYELQTCSIISHGDGFILLPWLGSSGQLALQLALITNRLNATSQSITIEIPRCSKDDLRKGLKNIVESASVSPVSLAMLLPEKTIDKFDRFLDTNLQARNFAAARLDTSRLQGVAAVLLADLEKL